MNKERTWLYSIARALAAVVCRCIFFSKARGLENFPRDENCILLGNHISAWDPVTVAHYYKPNEVHFMGKESLFKNPVLRTLFKWLHAFPVYRGERDMRAMRTAMQVLYDGHVLGIFPEGTRQRDDRMQSIETGVAVIALKSDVPLIPICISGRYRLFGKVRMVVGPPIKLDDLRGRRADTPTLEETKSRIIDAVEALRPLTKF